MAAAAAPIKIDHETDELVSHAAHFLGRAKKDIVDAAVREYIEAHREEITSGVRQALRRLDGSTSSALSLLSGVSDLDEFGGLPAE
ncbi:MAG: hypothetical protein ACTHOD_08200 [Motilibacteraceae bacterium]